MRIWYGTCLVAGMCLVGCQSKTQPAAQRNSGGSAPNSAADRAPSSSPTTGDQASNAREVALDLIKLRAPEGWPRQTAASEFITAEFVLPRAEGDNADGRLTVSAAGGSIDDNIGRWKGQFGDAPAKEAQRQIEVAGLKITIVDFSGEFNDQRGPFAPPDKRSGYRMLGAIIPVGDKMYFVKATGPEKTIAAQVDQFDAFLRTLEKQSL